MKDRSLTAMLDYDDFDFQEHMEEERELSQQQKPSPQSNDVPAGAIIGVIVAVAIIILMIVFSDFLGPILIVGCAAYILARWLLG
ncbi:MAG: hypothetical protein IKB00_01455 [Bacteroidaceae bacterium]|nr:hypothetical protein [Bacteroidaceae bacterium]